MQGGGTMKTKSLQWKERTTTPEKAVWNVKSGDRVFIGTACAAPSGLVHALENSLEYRHLKDVQLIHFVVDNIYPMVDGRPTTSFKHKVFYVGNGEQQIINQGQADRIDFVPISISQVPHLFETGRLPIDVALIQTTYPDEHGYVSLGISVDITKAAVENAGMVIAEVNPSMPWTRGDSFIPVDRIDHMVEVDTPLSTYSHPEIEDAVVERIARYIATIIEDGSTLQIGMGRYSIGVLKHLNDQRNLGIHSDVITDEIIDLIEKGIITGNEKTHYRGRIVTSYCMGTERLYKYVDNNPMFYFQPIETVCRPDHISRNRRMVSITQAWAIDLMGQVCSGQLDGELYGGVSAQPDFIRGAAESDGGKSIICLESTYIKDGEMKSRIRSLLGEGEGVTVSRADVHYVATEWGIDNLFTKSIPERALRLIQMAHPVFRDELMAEAKQLGYIREDYVLESKQAYPADEERQIILKNGEPIRIRPAKASDFGGMRDLFYHLNKEDVDSRFHGSLSSLPESRYDFLVNVDYANNMAFVAIAGKQEDERIVANSNYILDDDVDLVEFAYMVHQDWQRKGLAGHLKRRMIEYAQSKNARGYFEIFDEENKAMKGLAEKSENVTVAYVGGKVRAETLF